MDNPAKENDSLPIGATVYTRKSLRLYDTLVHGISNRMIWKCPAKKIVEHGKKYLTTNHLEIGIGSGKLFRKVAAQKEFDRLYLADVNQDCLDFSQAILAGFHPKIWRLNLLEDVGCPEYQGFDSIGLNYVLHCLPISLEEKVALCTNLMAKCLAEGGVLFGSTLCPDLNPNFMSKRLMSFYNRKGIFTNVNDSATRLVELLENTGMVLNHQSVGCVCMFALCKKVS